MGFGWYPPESSYLNVAATASFSSTGTATLQYTFNADGTFEASEYKPGRIDKPFRSKIRKRSRGRHYA